MKLGTLKDGTRDGSLVVVSRHLKMAQIADDIAPTLQAALDDWATISPKLDALAAQLERTTDAPPLDQQRLRAPLPRAASIAVGL